MIKNLTCIECPKGCRLTVEQADDGTLRVTGNQCPKGERYGVSETRNPVRWLTSTVLAEGLALKMVPVKTSQPIPQKQIIAAMEEIKKIRLTNPVKCRDVIVKNFLNLGIDLVATRNASTASIENG